MSEINWFSVVLTSSVIGSIISPLGNYIKEVYFDKKVCEKRTKTLAIKVVYILEKFALECGQNLSDVVLYDRNKGCAGKQHSKLPSIALDVENINWENLDIEYIEKINNLILEKIVAQDSINFCYEIGDEYDISSQFKDEICLIGKNALDIACEIRRTYKLKKQTIKEDGSIKLIYEKYEEIKK